MIRLLVTLILAGFSLCSYASGDWKGKILDENGQALPYATVALLKNADSTLVTGITSAADGSFKLVTSKQSGMLMVSMIGYKTLYVKPEQDCVLKLSPDVTSLGAATALATLPKTKLTDEGLRTSVRGSVLENIGTAEDVLEKTPGIIKTRDGIQVLGKGSPLIFINGRKMVDATELGRIQGNDIQSVEVITNPGAQYDASVSSVVRIRTIRRDGEGFGFNAALYDGQSLRVRDFNDPSANIMPITATRISTYSLDSMRSFFPTGRKATWSTRSSVRLNSTVRAPFLWIMSPLLSMSAVASIGR